MLKPIYLSATLLMLFIYSCQLSGDNTGREIQSNELLKEGVWRLSMELPDAHLPFNLSVARRDSGYVMTVYNDVEEIVVTDIRIINDSFEIHMPVFQSYLKGRVLSDTSIEGNWHNLAKGTDYLIPFKGRHGIKYRFSNLSKVSTQHDYSGKYEVTFSPESEKPCKAIGLFKQNGDRLSGTFITETGDYRFLEGQVVNDSLLMSCFDGSHAFLFKAGHEGKRLNGKFWSGKHWQEPWYAVPNDTFELTNPDSLTFLKPGYEHLNFSFPDLDSNIVALTDEKFENKVVIVQIMGSWCPNCADETAFLSKLYDKYNHKGLEIVALGYEKTTDFKDAVRALNKVKHYFNADYTFLLAGKADKIEAQKTLPMLNHIMSYPTCIFIDRDMNIRKIRTGFYGPGTGEIHKEYIREIEEFTEMLLMKSPV